MGAVQSADRLRVQSVKSMMAWVAPLVLDLADNGLN